MPTGYTADLTPDSSLRDFALSVARQYGALIHMRDEPNNAPLTLPETSDYHDKQLLKANLWLGALETMTDAKKKAEALKAFKTASDNYRKWCGEAIIKREAYRAMLAKTEAWQAPTPAHEALKADMIRQLTESDKYDNGILDDADRLPKLELPGEWHAAALKRAKWDVDYHTKARREEEVRTAERRQWVIDLQNSLPA